MHPDLSTHRKAWRPGGVVLEVSQAVTGPLLPARQRLRSGGSAPKAPGNPACPRQRGKAGGCSPARTRGGPPVTPPPSHQRGDSQAELSSRCRAVGGPALSASSLPGPCSAGPRPSASLAVPLPATLLLTGKKTQVAKDRREALPEVDRAGRWPMGQDAFRQLFSQR